jgi:hypothetical protein
MTTPYLFKPRQSGSPDKASPREVRRSKGTSALTSKLGGNWLTEVVKPYFKRGSFTCRAFVADDGGWFVVWKTGD